jgi:predicted SPOUT superfamily RNA methylase MTH1
LETVEQKGRNLSVAIPASLVSDTPHLREKTAKLGLIGRACSIFGVNEILLYADDARGDQQEELRFCAQILSFLETPQYLRKRMFRLSPALRYTGILSPLQTPPHDVPHSLRESKVGDIREGIVTASKEDTLVVDVGLERAIRCHGRAQVGSRQTIRITRVERELAGEIADPSNIGKYWGFSVNIADAGVGKLAMSDRFDLTIGTSRYGRPVEFLWTRLTESVKATRSILVVFGSPKKGLQEILKQEGKTSREAFDYFINTVPNQNVSTVRTEEAILISLGILNLAFIALH